MRKLRFWAVTLLLSSFLFLPMGIANDVPFADVPFDVNNIPEPVPPPKEVRDFFDLDPFYQRWISVAGFPILASAKVSPYALKEAAYVIWQMIGHRRDLLKAMALNKIRLPVIAYNEIVCQIPEHKQRINPAFCFFPEVRARASFCPGCLTVTANEENLLHYFTGPPSTFSVLVHEFAHALHETGLNTIAPEFDNRLRASYNSAMQKGLWAETYAASNYSEYWAEAVGSWFHAAHDGNPVKTQSALKMYDPALATLLTEVFGNSDWRYTPSTTRTHLPHLQGFNPQNSPVFERDPESVRVYEELFNPAINERDEWVNLRPYDPSVIPILNASRTRGEVSHMMGLTNLTFLWLEGNNITDISAVAGLTNLTRLDFGRNSIPDISAVAGLTNVTSLWLWGNKISDITPVTGLNNLTRLGLWNNNISDLSSLVANTGLGSGDTVYVQNNPLSYLSIHTHIPALQSRGVTVEFDADGTRPPDVNSDGNINVLDLILIASELGNTSANIAADVSGDGIVNVLDIVLVAGTFEDVATAPSAQPQAPEMLTAVEVQGWLIDAKSLEGSNPIIKRGILVLEQFLVSLAPTKTELLANYQNPFNPETWIPYRLAEDAFVTLTIYDTVGQVVRTLDVGHRIASAYESRSQAVYWDGRNGLGEQVASGVYFYTLTAGDFSATQRMLILK